jgi:hypothetical protein
MGKSATYAHEEMSLLSHFSKTYLQILAIQTIIHIYNNMQYMVSEKQPLTVLKLHSYVCPLLCLLVYRLTQIRSARLVYFSSYNNEHAYDWVMYPIYWDDEEDISFRLFLTFV